MKLQKLDILQHSLLHLNDSGEEVYGYGFQGNSIIGKVSFAGGTDSYGNTRNSSETILNVHCTQLYPWLNRRDRFMYGGKEWAISAVPELWENSRGYRSATVITATSVEG